MRNQLLVLGVFLSLNSFGATQDCTDIKNKSNKVDISINNLNEDYKMRVELNTELNNITNGSLQGAMKSALKLSFLFASKETKQKINDFFTKSLSVDFKRKLIVPGDLVEQIAISENHVQATEATDFAKAHIQKLAQAEIVKEKQETEERMEKLKGRLSNSDFQGFADTAYTASEQEIEMAKIRELLVVLEQYKSKLKELGQSCNL